MNSKLNSLGLANGVKDFPQWKHDLADQIPAGFVFHRFKTAYRDGITIKFTSRSDFDVVVKNYLFDVESLGYVMEFIAEKPKVIPEEPKFVPKRKLMKRGSVKIDGNWVNLSQERDKRSGLLPKYQKDQKLFCDAVIRNFDYVKEFKFRDRIR